MSSQLRAPSHRSRISRPLALSLTARSGSTTRSQPSAASKRRLALRARRGLAWAASTASSRRHRISHLRSSAATTRSCSGALRACSSTKRRPGLGVPRRLLRARAEVAQPRLRDPGIVLLEGRQPLAHDRARRQLRERGRDAGQKIVRLDEADVVVARLAHAGQHQPQARHLVPIESDGFGEGEPLLEAAFAGALSVVVVDPAYPLPAEGRALRLAEDDPVLERNARLVVVAVAHPGPKLGGAEPAFVHAQVERVAVVVPLGQDLAQPGFEPGRGGRAHTSSSRPSSAISTPAARTQARSLPRASRIGFVLLMWM